MAIIRPPLIERRWQARPIASNWHTHTASFNLNLRNKDQFFNAPGQPPTYDWPNPKAPQRAQDLNTFLNSVNLRLLSKDQFYTAAGKAPNFDWPNPKAPERALSLNTHVQAQNLNLRSKDLFFTVAGLGPDYDWPNPKGPVYPLSLRTHTLSPSLTTLRGQDKFFSAAGIGPDYDWPNPKGSPYPLTLRTHTESPTETTLSNPFNQTFWPLYKPIPIAASLGTHLNLVNLNLLGKDALPFAYMGWTVPQSAALPLPPVFYPYNIPLNTPVVVPPVVVDDSNMHDGKPRSYSQDAYTAKVRRDSRNLAEIIAKRLRGESPDDATPSEPSQPRPLKKLTLSLPQRQPKIEVPVKSISAMVMEYHMLQAELQRIENDELAIVMLLTS